MDSLRKTAWNNGEKKWEYDLEKLNIFRLCQAADISLREHRSNASIILLKGAMVENRSAIVRVRSRLK